jgi:hypothetical protein
MEETVRETVGRVMKSNGWLNYPCFRRVAEVKTVGELWDKLSNYVGTFRYGGLLFFNDEAYGCFVYVVGRPDIYVEHLSIFDMTSESFGETVEVLRFRLEGNRFARYHEAKGHSHDLWHEYAIVLRKVM